MTIIINGKELTFQQQLVIEMALEDLSKILEGSSGGLKRKLDEVVKIMQDDE